MATRSGAETAIADPIDAPILLHDRVRSSVAPVLRRVPEQHRSWQRVEAALQAADGIMRTSGLEALLQNPSAVAAQAGMPTGTFYTYFENTDTVVECLRRVWVERIHDIADQAFADPCASWQEVADRVVDVTQRFFSLPSTRILWLSHQLSRAARVGELDANRHIAGLVQREVENLGQRYIGDETDGLALVEIADQLTRLAFTLAGGAEPHPDMSQRARTATRAFLGTLVQR